MFVKRANMYNLKALQGTVLQAAVCGFALIGLVAFAGCQEPRQFGFRPNQPPRIVDKQDDSGDVAGYSVQQRPIKYMVLGQGSDVVLIIAAIHGNEYAGTSLVRRLAEHLRLRPELLNDRKIVLVPVVNPDGLKHNTRFNSNGVDLNRNFNAPNRQNSAYNGFVGLSEPESRAIVRIVQRYKPNRIVTIHQPLNCIDYDGPGQAIADHMAMYSDLPVKKLGARPGSLGSYAGEVLGTPIITVELPSDAASSGVSQLWKKYGPMLLAAVTYPQQAI